MPRSGFFSSYLQDENVKRQQQNLLNAENTKQAQEANKNLSVIKNIDACKQLTSIAQTSLGPVGSTKPVYQLFLNELVVQHPAPKVLVLAAKEQQKEFGDGANLVVSIAGHHLEGAKELITMGLNLSQIIGAYKKASNKLGEILEDLIEKGSETMDVRNKEEVILHLKHPVSSKLYDIYKMEDIMCLLIAEACIQVCPKNPVEFNVDNVRVARLLGVHPRASKTFKGMVLDVNTVVGSIKTIKDARVLVVAGGVDEIGTKTHRVHYYEQLAVNYEHTEEARVILDSGAKVIVSGAAVGRRALQFCNDNKIMVLKISSRSELDCFCRTTDAVALLELKSFVDSCIGHVDSISVEKTRGARVTVTKEQGCVATVLLGVGRFDNIHYEQLQRAVVSGVKTYKALCKDSRVLPGAGATEIEIAKRLKEFSLTQYGSSSDTNAIAKYAESFELIPKTFAEHSYLDVEDIMKKLKSDHEAGNFKVGIDVEEGACKDASTLKIWDLYTTKYSALLYAADAVCDALSVDQDPEPQSMFDRLMVEQGVGDEFIFKHELPTHKIISIFWESIRANNLQPKREMEMLAVKIHGDKLFGLSPDGTLYSFDIHTSKVCWSILVDRALDLDFSFKTSQSECSYYVDSSRVFMHTKDTKPVDLCTHEFEFVEYEYESDNAEVTPSILVTQIFVDPVMGCRISPVRSRCEEILCVRTLHGQLIGYEPGTNNVLWYERVATFDMRIVSPVEGVKLQRQLRAFRRHMRRW